MLKKTIKYEDFNGTEREEDFYFNLSKAELVKMATQKSGSFTEYLERLVKEQNQEEIYKMFTDIVLSAYGEKSEDGRRFIKSAELSKAFSETPAFDELLMEMMTDANAASTFVNGILPKGLLNKLNSQNLK